MSRDVLYRLWIQRSWVRTLQRKLGKKFICFGKEMITVRHRKMQIKCLRVNGNLNHCPNRTVLIRKKNAKMLNSTLRKSVKIEDLSRWSLESKCLVQLPVLVGKHREVTAARFQPKFGAFQNSESDHHNGNAGRQKFIWKKCWLSHMSQISLNGTSKIVIFGVFLTKSQDFQKS